MFVDGICAFVGNAILWVLICDFEVPKLILEEKPSPAVGDI